MREIVLTADSRPANKMHIYHFAVLALHKTLDARSTLIIIKTQLNTAAALRTVLANIPTLSL